MKKALLFGIVLVASLFLFAATQIDLAHQVKGNLPAANLTTGISFASPEFDISAAGSGNGVLGLKGNTSGTATFTAPAVAGTTTNAVAVSNVLSGPDGALASGVTYGFTSATQSGMYRVAGNGDVRIARNGSDIFAFSSGAATLNGALSLQLCGTGFSPCDIGLSRGAAGLVDIGTGAAGSIAGFMKSAQMVAVTAADVTCGTGGTLAPCTAFTTITGLSAALPLVVANWRFDCDLIVSQATAAAANQIGVQTATNGATNLAASGIAYTAAATSTAGAFTGQASTTTAVSIVTFTPGGTGTKLPIHIAGTVEGASASGTTLNIVALTGAAADLMTIYRGSSCYVY